MRSRLIGNDRDPDIRFTTQTKLARRGIHLGSILMSDQRECCCSSGDRSKRLVVPPNSQLRWNDTKASGSAVGGLLRGVEGVRAMAGLPVTGIIDDGLLAVSNWVSR